jgi:Peptidase inhibitor family I36
MNNPRRLMAKIAIIVAAVAAMAATPVTAAVAAPHAAQPTTTAKITAGAYVNCPAGDYCDFTSTSGNGSRLLGSGNLLSWGSFRNHDESFANRTSGLVRLYYHPNLKGDWVCINASAYQNNLAGYIFNNGPAGAANGQGAPIENNVASSQAAAGQSCSNPLPWP